MGRKTLGWSAIVLGILGVLAFVVLIAASVFLRSSVRDWTGEHLLPAGRAIDRLAFRLTETGHRTDSTRQELEEIVATGSDRLLAAVRRKVTQLEMDLIALEASIMSVDSSMKLISALPFFAEERRGFKADVRAKLTRLREDLAQVSQRLAEADSLAAEIRKGGDAAEKARTVLRALAGKLAPKVAKVRSFLQEVGTGLTAVKARLGSALDRVGRGLTMATAAFCFVFAWLGFAHYCVYLAGKRMLEEHARLAAAVHGDSVPDLPGRV